MVLAKRQNGLTLIEVMVAMAILATAAAAILKTIAAEQNRFSNRKMQVIAEWVAQNKMNETLMFEKFPNTGTTRGSVENGDIEWHWVQTVKNTSDKNLRRIEVEVKDDPDSEFTYALLTGFAGQFSSR